jgi:2-amino-4-hydroxy-6-hydroxymethyldihydropteridine diphosphokinase
MAIVYLGIGSNLGSRETNIRSAIGLMVEHGLNILKCSTIIETDPVGGPSIQRKFLNGVLKAETELNPKELLILLNGIEYRIGRRRSAPNDPRPIDLDILLYNHLSLQTPSLTIPHPRMLKRDFVMRPLREIEPQLAEELFHAHH